MPELKYQVLARRYRPQTFRDVVGQESTVTTLKNALRLERTAHAYLFSGSRGVGKTTLARLFAKTLNCQNKSADLEPCNQCPSCLEISSGQSLDVIEIDGASNRGIDDIRQIAETACYSPAIGRYKIYIVDEVHMLTKEAFNALLKTLEEPPEKAKFLFATTEPHKVLPTIISRCQRFDLGRLQVTQITQKLEQIAKDLNRNISPEAVHLIASFSEGSLRDAESLFDQILCFAQGDVTLEAVRSSLGLISQEEFFSLDFAFSTANIKFAFELVDSLFVAGKDLAHFFEQLIEHVRMLALAKISGQQALPLPGDLAAQYMKAAQLYTSSQCLYLLEYLLRIEPQLHKSTCQRIALEAALLHYIQSKNRIPVEILIRRLDELQRTSPILDNEIKPPPQLQPNIEAKLPPPLAGASPTCQRQVEQRIIPDLEETAGHNLNPSVPPEKKSSVPRLEELPAKAERVSAPHPVAPEVINKEKPVKKQEKPLSKEESPPKEPPPQERRAEPQQADSPKNLSPTEKLDQASYDTLMRFAAVELEGTLKLKSGG